MSEDTKSKAPEAKEAPQAPATEQAKAPELSIVNLQGIKTIIDVASQRGAFKPNEMVSIGTVYNKLEVFLNAVSVAQQNQQTGENNGS